MGVVRTVGAVVAAGLLLTACGTTPTDRALSGGAIGAGGGAVIGALVEMNPLLGALGGAVAGAAVGLLADPEDADLGTPDPGRGDPSPSSPNGPASDSGNADDAASPPRKPQSTAAEEVLVPPVAAPPALGPVALAVQEIALLQTERRTALVVGNGAYRTGPLRNPRHDARDVAAALRELGFDVIEKHDVGYNEMLHAVIEFGRALQDGGVGLFYYAGHGLQLDGKNYLIPTDASLEREEYVPVETLDLDQVLARMDAARNRLNVVVLDACRDNPFARSFRSVPRGLTQALAPSGTFLAYATAPGDVAADGDGRNSPYAEAILTALKPPGLGLEDVFKRVRVQVRERTEGQQTPWTSSSVVGDFYFRPPVPAPVSPVAAEGYGGEDIAVWNVIKDSVEPHDLRTFLEVYPDSPLAPFALTRLQAFGSR
jgi:hypothetical protein